MKKGRPKLQLQAMTDIRIQTAPFLLRGDKSYWSQIMFNLTENALKNNPAPGLRVEISASCLPGGIEVADNGRGIEAEALPFIFNRFFRADATGKVKGSGLGLAIVRHAVEAHGGTICPESQPGGRTSFRITLPPSA